MDAIRKKKKEKRTTLHVDANEVKSLWLIFFFDAPDTFSVLFSHYNKSLFTNRKDKRCHSFMVLHRTRDVSAADW